MVGTKKNNSERVALSCRLFIFDGKENEVDAILTRCAESFVYLTNQKPLLVNVIITPQANKARSLGIGE